ncbi:hypothetical protein EYF80_063059 [Liparis tanakae]|uniref:Uncharacterized protein n=1 Tax=Liparis tanakae TaxID=230148 RepID=A0A4Z2EET1_9TELE|nr:hypothetical protein EYF80_063059 [Liparis tanakae]
MGPLSAEGTSQLRRRVKEAKSGGDAAERDGQDCRSKPPLCKMVFSSGEHEDSRDVPPTEPLVFGSSSRLDLQLSRASRVRFPCRCTSATKISSESRLSFPIKSAVAVPKCSGFNQGNPGFGPNISTVGVKCPSDSSFI